MHHFLSLFWLAALLGGTIIFLFLQFKTNRQPVPAKIAGVTSATRTCFFFCGSAQEMFYSFQPHMLATPWIQDILVARRHN